MDLPQIYPGLLISTVVAAVVALDLTATARAAEIWAPPVEDQVAVEQVPRSAHVEQQ
jgi:hypothetical protein